MLERNATVLEYDAHGNLTRITRPEGESISMEHDSNGQVTRITDASGAVRSFTYDSWDNVTSETDPAGNVWRMEYDSASRLTKATDPLGNGTSYEYDLMDRVTKITDSKGGVTTLGYDANGNLLWHSAPNAGVTRFAYDTRNRLIEKKDPLGRSEKYEYDLGGNLIKLTDRKGQVTEVGYDFVDRPLMVTGANAPAVIYEYDAVGNVVGISDDFAGTVTRAYDSLNRLARETGAQGTVKYGYDALGRRTSMSVAGQPSVYYDYDRSGKVLGIRGPVAVSLEYDSAGRRTAVRYPGGADTTYTYDTAGRLSEIDHGLFESMTYGYDKSGNVNSSERTAGTIAQSDIGEMSYDAANRLLSIDGQSVTHDSNGNMTSMTDSCGTTTYTWDTRNQLSVIQGFTPDCEPVVAQFEYDGLGRRISRNVDGVTTKYVYDGWDIVQEIEDSQVKWNYLRTLSIDEPLARIGFDGTKEFYHADMLGSITAITDEDGAVKTQYAYSPFGESTEIGESSDNPFRYTSREYDATGLMNYRHRYYNPKLGRFISEDPIGLEGGVNLYAYVRNNPLTLIDPLGLCDGYDIANTWSNYGNYGPNWNEFQRDRDIEPLINAYQKTMNTVASYSQTINDWLPDYLRPTGAPYPGIWRDIWKALAPIKGLL